MRDAPAERVVVDANVWISALVFGGTPRRVFEDIVREGLVLVVSAEILTEVRRIVAVKFPDFVADVEALLRVLSEQTATVALGAVTITASRDPDDNRVIETAELGEAPLIVSGDSDLLDLGSYRSIAITRPADWLTDRAAAAAQHDSAER
ncbi:putative toxin-antitoxin system toxin component, PIN family [Microbacterium sp.]|uniref:putative toxin-antitoxin system toxin component, PIN family n=1 Tax=Microbacterium sp. TaxID=51671 RepID=UPI003C74B42C